VLSGFTAEDIESTIENGEIRVECEFCSTVYRFDPVEFQKPN
jgi:molecular chaperone Hsp33